MHGQCKIWGGLLRAKLRAGERRHEEQIALHSPRILQPLRNSPGGMLRTQTEKGHIINWEFGKASPRSSVCNEF